MRGRFLLSLALVLFELGVDGCEIAALLSHPDDLIRRATIVFGNEFQIDQIDDVGIGKLNFSPLGLLPFLIVTIGITVRRAGIAFYRDIKNLGRQPVMGADRHPGFPAQAKLDYRLRSYSGTSGNEKNHRQFIIGNLLLPNNDDLLFRDAEVLAESQVECLETAVFDGDSHIDLGPALIGRRPHKHEKNQRQKRQSTHFPPPAKYKISRYWLLDTHYRAFNQVLSAGRWAKLTVFLEKRGQAEQDRAIMGKKEPGGIHRAARPV